MAPLPFSTKTLVLFSSLAFLALLASILTGLLLWASWGTLEESVTGIGELVPQGQEQRVMSPSMGIVAVLHVAENQSVKAGDVLLELNAEPTQIEADSAQQSLQMAQSNSSALMAAMGGRSTAPLSAIQQTWLQSAQVAHQAQLTQAQLAIEEAEHRVQELQTRLVSSQAVLASSQSRLADYTKLHQMGGLSTNDFESFRQKVISQQSETDSLKETLVTAQLALSQAKQRPTELAATWQESLSRQMKVEQEKINDVSHQIAKSNFALNHLVIRAPIEGTINEVQVHGAGEVVSGGQVLFSIIPAHAPLYAQVRISNRDLSYITPGQQTTLHIDAYPYQQFGVLHGRVIDVSPSSHTQVIPGTGAVQAFYSVQIRPDRSQLVKENQTYVLKPGMSCSADLIIRKKTLLSFLTDPIHQRLDRAFRDPTNR